MIIQEIPPGCMLDIVTFLAFFSAVLETWSKAVTLYFQDWAKCSFRRIEEAQLCDRTFPLYCFVTKNWLPCEEQEVRTAAFVAL